jgi:hypothetical protein
MKTSTKKKEVFKLSDLIIDYADKHPQYTFVCIYERSYVTGLYGETVQDVIKDFNKSYNSTIIFIVNMKTGELYIAKENDEPDCRGYYNHSYFHSKTNELVFNEDELTKPIVKLIPSEFSENGYIDRNGDFYKCSYQAHKYLAKELFLSKTIKEKEEVEPYDNERALDERGFVKVSDRKIYYVEYKESGIPINLTENQKDTILKYFDYNNESTLEFCWHKYNRNELFKRLYNEKI